MTILKEIFTNTEIKVGDVVKSRCYGNTEWEVKKVFKKLIVVENLSNGFHYTLAKNIFYKDETTTNNNNYIKEIQKDVSNRYNEEKYLTYEEVCILIGFLGVGAVKSAKEMLKRKINKNDK